MAQITLNALLRTAQGKQLNSLRKNGKIPGVLYGHKVEAQNLELNEREFAKTFKQAGESTIITLKVDGKDVPVLIQEVQRHYLLDHPIHVDFYAVNMTEKLKAHIPLHILGEAPAVKSLGGILVNNISEIEVECLPADLPHAVEIDISNLNNLNDSIRVADIKLSDKVQILTNSEAVIVTIAEPRTEEELKALEEKPVEADVTKVEGVVKPDATDVAASPEASTDKPEKVEKAEKPAKPAKE